MPTLRRHARRASLFAVLAIAAGSLALPLVGWTVIQPASVAPTIGSVAAQLGVKPMAQPDEEFAIGIQFTGTLTDTLKLGTFGLKGFSVGARVTVARIANDRVHIEADEFDPPRRQWVRVAMDANGKLAAPQKT